MLKDSLYCMMKSLYLSLSYFTMRSISNLCQYLREYLYYHRFSLHWMLSRTGSLLHLPYRWREVSCVKDRKLKPTALIISVDDLKLSRRISREKSLNKFVYDKIKKKIENRKKYEEAVLKCKADISKNP